jgi:hypothetical protein
MRFQHLAQYLNGIGSPGNDSIVHKSEHNARIVCWFVCNPALTSCYIHVSRILTVCDHHLRIPVVAQIAILPDSICRVVQSTHFYFLNCVTAVRTHVIHYSHGPGFLVLVLTIWAGTGPHNAHSQWLIHCSLRLHRSAHQPGHSTR